jgi:hypothetical protein
MKPDLVIMAAYWSLYDTHKVTEDPHPWDDLDVAQLAATVHELRNVVKSRVTLVGHLPTFDVEQPKMLKRGLFATGVEDRTYRNFSPTVRARNAAIRTIANNEHVGFVDPLSVLCNGAGCLISLSRERGIPLAFDYGQFDTIGSDYFVARLFAQGLLRI